MTIYREIDGIYRSIGIFSDSIDPDKSVNPVYFPGEDVMKPI
jgi:hypothetical protein